MSKEEQVTQLTEHMAKFIAHVAKKLPDDVIAKLEELRDKEDSPLSKTIYDTMFKNQELAVKLNRPSCQDTGVLQFWVKCGTKFPLIGELEALLKDAVVKATFEAPLRHNSVETFDEYNTGKNVGKGTPTVFWDIVPDSDECEIYTYMAGGGCTLPGKAMVLMPGEGYEGVTKFVMDVMTTYGLNACPPLLVGVGVATSVETAALLSKKALMRPIGSHNDNERAAKMEALLEDGINAIGLGPQGMGGKYSVMGVNIENTARHPSAIGVAVNVGCWSHRRGHIVFDKDLNYKITTSGEIEFSSTIQAAISIKGQVDKSHNVRLSATAITFYGGDMSDIIRSSAGGCVIYAGGGDDIISGVSVDTIYAQSGNNIINAGNYGRVYGGTGKDTITLASYNQVIDASGGCEIIANGHNNTIAAKGSNNTITKKGNNNFFSGFGDADNAHSVILSAGETKTVNINGINYTMKNSYTNEQAVLYSLNPVIGEISFSAQNSITIEGQNLIMYEKGFIRAWGAIKIKTD